ncbi:cellulase family glycosylhydrolase [Roseimarinus sediminis]|uniref:cellulase family glycosylhydrolase n=1 Tax=Roseimarinus sediminis TaxID=1610899 RepID=UPI003D1F98D5
MKTFISLVLTFFLFVTTFSQLKAQLAAHEAASKMKRGINLGNTLEPPLEGGWNNPKAEEYYFDMYRDAGFDVVRIPVRWDQHMGNSAPYQIDESWMLRVEQLADWALERGLFVIINAHHDDWIKSNYSSQVMRDRFDSLWSQVAVHFKDKSERLLFEILNEPHGLTKAQNDEMHQRVLSIIRASNPSRLVIFQGHNWGGSDELLQAAIPDDDYLIASFHSYDPYLFGLEGQGTWGTPNDYQQLKSKFDKVKEWSLLHDIPVILGEFGSLRKCDYNSRMRHYQAYMEQALLDGFIPCAWDDGGDFKIMNRQQKTWDEVKDILIYTTPDSPDNLRAVVYQDSIVRVSWNNHLADHDAIVVERRSPEGNYQEHAVLPKDAQVYDDVKPEMNATYHYRIIARYSTENDKPVYSAPVRVFFPSWEIPERVPYHGEAMPVPGTIEAEDYDIGGNGYTYFDLDNQNVGGDYRPDEGVDIYALNGGADYHVGNALEGEWYEYTVNVQKTASYKVEVFTTSLQGGGSYRIKVGDVESESVTVPTSSSWISTSVSEFLMELNAGEQILRFSIENADHRFNIDRFSFTRLASSPLHPVFADLRILTDARNQSITMTVAPQVQHRLQLSLHNLQGRCIRSAELAPGIQLRFDGLERGVYVIKADGGKNGTAVHKVAF